MTANRIVIALGIFLSVLGLVYAFKGVDLPRVLAEVQRLRSGPLWISQGFFLSALVLRAIRWRYLLLKLKRFAFMPIFAATVIGMMANNIFPGRMGEVARAILLGRRENVSSASILANIVVERIVDILTLLPLLCVYLLFSGAETENKAFVEKTGRIVLIGGAVLVVGLFLFVRFESRVNGITAALVRPFSISVYERLERVTRGFASGLDVFQSWTQVLVVIGLSLGIWLSGVASFFYLLQSFSIHLHFLQLTLVFVIVTFGIALPSAPGYIGTFHAFAVAALSLVGVTDASLAAAFAAVAHGIEWIIVNVIGAYFLFRDGRHAWNSLWRW